jgi:hypothetical protein
MLPGDRRWQPGQEFDRRSVRTRWFAALAAEAVRKLDRRDSTVGLGLSVAGLLPLLNTNGDRVDTVYLLVNPHELAHLRRSGARSQESNCPATRTSRGAAVAAMAG